jgi:hypothetical protein
MDVDTALREIDEAEAKYVGSKDYERKREEYRRTFAELHRVATEADASADVDPGKVVADLTRWVSERIREEESLPPIGSVDRRASELLAAHDVDIPAESHLAPA